jgi:hypothetical protein
LKSAAKVLDDVGKHREYTMAHLTPLLGIALGIAMTAGLAWVAGRKPTPVPVRTDDRKRR